MKRSMADTSLFTKEQRILVAVWWHEHEIDQITKSDVTNKYTQRFGIKATPNYKTIKCWEKKHFSSGSAADSPRLGRPNVRTGQC